MNRFVTWFALCCALGATGCQTMQYTPDDPALPRSGEGWNFVREVQVEGTSEYMWWGRELTQAFPVNAKLAALLDPGQGFGDIEVTEKNTFGDGFLAAITLGILRPRTVIARADVFEEAR